MPTHVVCRGCPFEALIPVAGRVDRVVDEHEDETGHEVDHEAVADGQRLVTDGGQSLDAVAQSFAHELTQVVDRHPSLRRLAPHYMAAQLVCAVDGVADRQGLDITVEELDPESDHTLWAIEFYPPSRTPADDPYGEFLGAPRRDDGRVAVERLPDAEYTDDRLVTDGGEENDPLERLFHEAESSETVQFGNVEMDAEEFVTTLEELGDVASDLTRLIQDLDSLRQTGLREQDVVNLLYGRNAGLNKTTIETVIQTIDEVREDVETPAGREELLRRLVADLSGETQAETQEVFDELNRLRDRYGRNRGGSA